MASEDLTIVLWMNGMVANIRGRQCLGGVGVTLMVDLCLAIRSI